MRANWGDFLALADDPALQKAKFYYHQGWIRIEMSPVGRAHAEDNYLIAQIISIYAFSRGLDLQGLTNISLRKTGEQEAQPDLAYYLMGGQPDAYSNSPIDLDNAPAPALVLEVAATSLQDDLTIKRELYGQLGIQEYWIVDSNAARVLLFGTVAESQSLEPIESSSLLPGLSAAVLTEALRIGRQQGQAAAMRFVLNLSD
ncbi:Uma2 family endonuclease [Gloeobacter kilaueensis]|uniref:Uma2 family endonuclease n=1 Tax=Gloeobacter kilaueensis TaxID=1416614 RepID=UPI000413D0CE|nr:Uma2 family endonuclease [Gloeobacter kilaueensis]